MNKKKFLAAFALLFFVFAFSTPGVEAKPGEYKMLVKYLKTKYKAKKKKIPFLWLARFAVSVARPAGVKSFSITLFEDLQFSRETLDAEMQSMMRNSFSKEWSPILRIRSRDGEQVYMYMREAGKSVKVTFVTINKENAAIVRATFDPEKLAEFMENPKVFGVSLNDSDKQENKEIAEPKDADKDEEKDN